MIVVGLTGGIGAGKSTFAALLADLGAAVIDVDRIGRDVIAPGTEGATAVFERFGTTERADLAALVFNDPEALRDLEAISWPRIEREVRRRVAELRSAADAPPIVVLDMAVLDKGLGKGIYERVVTVEAAEDVRLARLVERGMMADDARARMRSQLDPSARRAITDVLVVENDGDLERLRRAAHDVVQRLGPL